MSTTIKPTVGRVVLVFFAAATSAAMDGYALPTDSSTPVPGLVTRVHSDSCINIAAFDVYGANLPLTSVRLLQDGDERPTSGCWAEWMPYQKQQAVKQANEVARADEPKLARADTSEAAIERDIQVAGLTAPRVTPSQIDALMQRIVYTSDVRPNGSTTTLVHAFLDGSFFLGSGVSACVSAENFDAQIGLKIATQNAERMAREKLWELEGYLLHAKLTR